MPHLLDPTFEITNLELKIGSLTKEAKECQDILDGIKAIFARLPDAMIYHPDLTKNNCIICSKSVNTMSTDYDYFTQVNEINPSAGHTMYVYPYSLIDGYKVYSNPPYFIVARDNVAGFGLLPEPAYEENMEKVGLPIKLLIKIKTFLKFKPPISY